MTHEKISPLGMRMIDDMRIHGMCDKVQEAHIRITEHFACVLGRSPVTRVIATEVQREDHGATLPFGTTCDREDMKEHWKFRKRPCWLPTEPSIIYWAGLLASEVRTINLSKKIRVLRRLVETTIETYHSTNAQLKTDNEFL